MPWLRWAAPAISGIAIEPENAILWPSIRETFVTDLCAEDLATIYAKPSLRVIAKARPAIDAHAKKFIEMSPF